MRVALLFGSFDPLHYGHLALAGYALGWGDVGEVWFVVSPQNPHKEASRLTPAEQRCEEVRGVLRGLADARLRVCDAELSMPLPSYTARTLNFLRKEYPSHSFSLLIGGDSLATLPSWREGERIMAENDILVYPRLDGTQLNEQLLRHPRVKLLDAPLVQLSSTFIREGWAAGRNMDFFTPVRRIQ